MFRVRVLATQEESAVIEQAARKKGLSAPQFVTRVIRSLARTLKARKIAHRRTSPRQKSLRRKPKS